MAATEQAVVCDAGPIIHLDEMQSLDLLADFSPLLIPDEVWTEATRHRPQLSLDSLRDAQVVQVTSPASARLAALSSALALHAGEQAALRLMEATGARMLLCDDSAARLAGESLGFEVHGTIGVIVRCIRRQLRTREEAIALLRDLPQRSTLHLSGRLLESVIAQIENSA